MTKQHSLFNKPRTELISSVQKGVFALLILLVVSAVGLYKFIDFEFGERAAKQSALTALQVHTYTVERYWFEWLLLDKGGAPVSIDAPSQDIPLLYAKLTEMYVQINQKLSRYQLMNPSVSLLNVKAELSFLDTMKAVSLDKVSLSTQDINQIHAFIENTKEQSRKITEQELMHTDNDKNIFNYSVWGPFVVFGLIAFVLFILTVYLVKRLGNGFQHLHVVLERHKQGSFTLDHDYKRVDEFTDLGRLLDNELSSREFECAEASFDLSLVTMAMSKLSPIFLIANEYGDVKWLSMGFSDLWRENAHVFEPLFNIDPGIDGPLGEQLPESILNGEHDIKLSLSNGRYSLVVEALTEEGSDEVISYLLMLTPLSQLAEIEVLRKSLELMVQGSWQYPIRMLRDDSPFKDFSVLLEEIRAGVHGIIETISALNLDNQTVSKITKLQQIKSFLTKKINDNEVHVNSTLPVATPLPELDSDELDRMASLSQQIYDTVLVGYELLLQRLMLVEKDVAGQVHLLNDVDRCLNEVRAGVLSSLSAAEGETDIVRHRFSVDLDHDIDSVHKQIESMQTMVSLTLSLLESDYSVGAARLDRAKQSVSELSERISGLLGKTNRFSDEKSDVENDTESVVALPNKTDKLDEF